MVFINMIYWVLPYISCVHFYLCCIWSMHENIWSDGRSSRSIGLNDDEGGGGGGWDIEGGGVWGGWDVEGGGRGGVF